MLCNLKRHATMPLKTTNLCTSRSHNHNHKERIDASISLQSYGLQELLNSIKHHPQNADSNFRLLRDKTRFRDQAIILYIIPDSLARSSPPLISHSTDLVVNIIISCVKESICNLKRPLCNLKRPLPIQRRESTTPVIDGLNVQKGDRKYTHAQIQMPHVLV
jgi:hypothetical protein